jgi:hypothetical protein
MWGTMTAESALMGVPTVSAFQGSLYTEDYLISVGLLRRTQSPTRLAKLVERILERNDKNEYARKARRILKSMEDPIPKISRFVAAAAREA